MNLLDLGIVILVVAVAARGLQAGLLRQTGSTGGFVLGLIGGAAMAPWFAGMVQTDNAKSIVAIVVVFGAAFTLSGLGELAGSALMHGAKRLKLDKLDEWGGAAFGVAVGLVTVWLLGALFARLPQSELQAQLQRSSILHWLDERLPPAPDVVARFGRLVAPNGFPSVFSGLEPSPPPPVTGPNAAAVNQAAAAGRAATVKIEGLGCGGVVDGTGFVAGDGLVATNAHVVAGIAAPVVYDAKGAHEATVVSFDPDLDFAVLRAKGLAAAPLPLASGLVARGTVGAALGYPGGGSFTISPAAVLESRTALGRNIYDGGLVKRDIYSLQADIRPGNSGGPLITPDGVVVGIIFARSVASDSVGYALTSAEVLPELHRAAASGAVATGACAAD